MEPSVPFFAAEVPDGLNAARSGAERVCMEKVKENSGRIRRIILLAGVLAVLATVGLLLNQNHGDDVGGTGKANETLTVSEGAPELLTPGVTDTSPRPLSEAEKHVLRSKYLETFPEENVEGEQDVGAMGELALRLELSAETWKRIREDKLTVEWEQRATSAIAFPSRYVGATIALEESGRVFEGWVRTQEIDITRQRELIETIWVMKGENEDSVIVLYVISASP